MWKKNNKLLINQLVNEKNQREFRKYLKTKENENTTYQILWDATKEVLREKWIAAQVSIKKEAIPQIDDFTL